MHQHIKTSEEEEQMSQNIFLTPYLATSCWPYADCRDSCSCLVPNSGMHTFKKKEEKLTGEKESEKDYG